MKLSIPNKSYSVFRVYFWQRIVTPHMANLAEALAAQGHEVTYVANEALSADRQKMGWIVPVFNHAKLRIAADKNVVTQIASSAPHDSIHICQGLRGNGLVRVAQKVLARRGVRQWTIMETVDDASFSGFFKRALYRWHLISRQKTLQGILAIGWKTSDWLFKRGAQEDQLFSFTYFLSDTISSANYTREASMPLKFLFVGQLIERKRLDHLIQALALFASHEFELVVIGDGPMRSCWEAMANKVLPNRVRWLGRMSMDKIPQQMANADCLVLPSRHDGWGAVVSEALMVGTPVICSDACGSAGIVVESGFGGVFSANDKGSLVVALQQMLQCGTLSCDDRQGLVAWAKSLGAEAGAQYLHGIIAHQEGIGERPKVPWITNKAENAKRNHSKIM